MKELMRDIEERFFKNIPADSQMSSVDIMVLYTKVQKEVYQEYLSTMMERNN